MIKGKLYFCNLGELTLLKTSWLKLYTEKTEERVPSNELQFFFLHSASHPEALSLLWCISAFTELWRMLSSVSDTEAGHLTVHL